MSVREGYKQTEIGVIPEEWEVVELKDIATLGKEKFTPSDNNTLKYIGLEHIDQNTGRLLSVGNSNETMSMKNIFSEGDILFGKLRPYLRKYHLASFDGVCSTEILSLRANTNTDRAFLFNIIQTDGFIEHSTSKMFGTKMPRTNWNILKVYKLPLPPLPEQQKIATILTSVDNKIEVIDEQIAKTEQLKKGLMQKLLSEGIGHTEFKESEIGRIPKEWEVVRLGDCIVNKGQYGINAPATDFNENLPTYLRITDIDENGNFIASNRKCVAHQDSDDFILKDGDIVFARTGNTTGKSYLYNPKDGKLVFAGFLIKFTPQQDKLYPYYLKLITQTQRYWNWVKVTSTRTGQPGINSEEYAKFVLPLPPIQEQKQIAIILSTADSKLDSLREKRFRYEKLKKGLMQKLLMGEVRVKI